MKHNPPILTISKEFDMVDPVTAIAAIKSLHDLGLSLAEKVSGRDGAAEVREFLVLISTVEQKHFVLESQNLDLQKTCAAYEKEIESLKDQNAKLIKRQQSNKEARPKTTERIPEEAEKILMQIAGRSQPLNNTFGALSEARGKYFADLLWQRHFITPEGTEYVGMEPVTKIGATKEGREYLFQHNLLE